MRLKLLLPLLALSASALVAQPNSAHGTALGSGASKGIVVITDAWVRATVPGQTTSGAFMKLTAQQATQLVAVSSALSAEAEVHEMKMDGDVMRMRAVPTLPLAAGQTVELKPGGYHVMLLDLKTQLKVGSSLPLTLTFKNAQGVQSTVQINAPVLRTGNHH